MPDLASDSPRDIAPAAAVVLAGTVAAMAGSVGVRWVLARSLSPAELGLVALAIAVVSALGGLAGLGTGAAGPREIAAARARHEAGRAALLARSAVRAAVVAGAILALLTALGAPWIARALGQPAMAAPLRALVPVVLAVGVGLSLFGVARAHGDVLGRALLRDTLGGLARLAGVGAAALAGATLVGHAAGYAAGVVVGELAFAGYVWRRGWLPRPAPGVEPAGLVRRLPPYVGFEATSQAVQWFDTLLLGALGTASAVGLYSLARGLIRATQLAGDAASHRYLPALAAAFATGEPGRPARIHSQTRIFVTCLVAPALAPCLLAPGRLLGAIFGAPYAAGAPALRLLAAALALSTVAGYADRALLAGGWTAAAARLRAVGLAAGAAVAALAIPRWGALGAAAGWAAMTLTLRCGESWALWRLARLPPVDAGEAVTVAVLAAAAAAAAAVAHAAALGPWPTLGTIAGATGAAALAVLAGIHRRMR